MNNNLKKNINFQIDIKSTFLGSKGENKDLVKELVDLTLKSIFENRLEINKLDDPIFDDEHLESEDYKKSKAYIIQKTNDLLNYLKESIQFSSPRVQSFMFADTTIGSLIGNIATLFYNQTNIIYQLSNTTTPLEFIIINDFCKLIDFPCNGKREISFEPISDERLKQLQLMDEKSTTVNPFGHLTSGGSLSNIEAYWCSFLVKFLSISIKQALLNEEKIKKSKFIKVNSKKIYSNDYLDNNEITMEDILNNEINLISLSNWDLLNIDMDEVLRIPFIIANQCDLKIYDVYDLIKKYHPQYTGVHTFLKKHNLDSPVFIAPQSAHYSIQKAVGLLGLGAIDGVKYVKMDMNNRMNISDLNDILFKCYEKRTPVLNVTNIMGSTQDSAIDYLDQIVQLREHFRESLLMDFFIHTDAAYGGMFLSCIREDFPIDGLPTKEKNSIVSQPLLSPFQNFINEELDKNDLFKSELIINDHLKKQFNFLKYSDTITIDPHKHGFINFSAGGIFYRNEKVKYILSNTTVYIGGFSVENLGIYGLEGSRCGQAAAAVYLTNSIIRPSKIGYGRLLKRSLLNSKLFHLGLLILNEIKENGFKVFTLNKPPKKKDLEFLKLTIFGKSQFKDIDDLVFPNLNDILWSDKLIKKISNAGPDLNVVCYTFNKNSNFDYKKYIVLNESIIKRFSFLNAPNCDLLLSSTYYNENTNDSLVPQLIKQFGLKTSIPNKNISIPFLRSLTIDPFVNETTGDQIFTNIFKILKNEIDKIEI